MNTSKRSYHEPEIELIRLECRDVITTSSGNETEWDPQQED